MNIQFTIRGRPFNVRTDDDGLRLKTMVADLDQRLKKQADRSKKLDEHSVAIITALDLMDEGQMEREKLLERIESLEKELSSTIAMVESLLPKP
jgi:cell division protein ZapA (FtsZ GTPase activity inhibitor)